MNYTIASTKLCNKQSDNDGCKIRLKRQKWKKHETAGIHIMCLHETL